MTDAEIVALIAERDALQAANVWQYEQDSAVINTLRAELVAANGAVRMLREIAVREIERADKAEANLAVLVELRP